MTEGFSVGFLWDPTVKYNPLKSSFGPCSQKKKCLHCIADFFVAFGQRQSRTAAIFVDGKTDADINPQKEKMKMKIESKDV